MNFVSWLRHAVKSAWFWITIWVVSVVLAACVISIVYWDWLSIRESNGSTIRNIVLATAALIALPLAVWRSMVAAHQADTARRQAETAQRSLLNERYQKGAEMLGSAVLSVRLAGIYALDRLAKNHAEGHHIQIMRLFSAFICNPPKDQAKDNAANDEKVQNNSSGLRDPNPKIREDIQAVMECLGNRSDGQLKIEDREGYILDLCNADLSGVVLMDKANLFWASLWDVNLRHAYLVCADLSHARLCNADLSFANLGRAILTGADLSGARLLGTNLSAANLSAANLSYSDFDDELPKDLTQEQLDSAVADPSTPPILTDVKDRKTGKPLVWRGASLSD